MKAAVYTRYGPPDVVQITDVEKPAPKDKEVLIRVRDGQRYDLILAANAYHSIFDYRRALSQDGIYVIAGGGLPQIFQAMLLAPFLSWIGSKKTCFFIANIKQKDLVFLKDLLETGKVVPVIDRRYPLSAVAEALRYLEEGHAQGKVVITVEHGNNP